MNIKIRNATINDVQIISNIYALSWKSAYKGIVPQKYLDEMKNDFWVSSFKTWISNNTLTVKLIFENDIPVGCIAYGKSRDEKYADWGEIVSIYLLPEYFRKGYGQALINTALNDMKATGYNNCYLWVLKENKNARKFYESNNFISNNDEFIFEIMGKELVDIRYVLTINYNEE